MYKNILLIEKPSVGFELVLEGCGELVAQFPGLCLKRIARRISIGIDTAQLCCLDNIISKTLVLPLFF